MARWRGAHIAAALLALVLLPGCALPDEPVDGAEAATTAGVTSAPATEEATTPATESSGTGNGTRSQTDEPAVTVPQLPIGGGADDPGEVEQCVSVAFLGDVIPAGVAIVPDAVAFSEPLFERGGSECSSGDTPCLSAGFAFTAENDDTQEGICYLAVRAIGERAPDDFDDVRLTMSGRLECPAGEDAACEAFAQELDADEQSIPLTPPTAGTTAAGTTASGTTSSGTTSSGTTASGTTAKSTEATEEASSSDLWEAPHRVSRRRAPAAHRPARSSLGACRGTGVTDLPPARCPFDEEEARWQSKPSSSRTFCRS